MWSGLGRFRVFILLLKIMCLLAVLGLHCSLAFSWLHRVGAPLQLRRAGSLLWWLLWLLTTGSGPPGFSHSGSWVQSTGSVLGAHGFSSSAACENFQDQGSNLCLLHSRPILYCLSHQGSLQTLEAGGCMLLPPAVMPLPFMSAWFSETAPSIHSVVFTTNAVPASGIGT